MVQGHQGVRREGGMKKMLIYVGDWIVRFRGR
jgi:hypothetical protein